MYVIDKNIPTPPPSAPKALYPFRMMEVGDSFLIPCEGDEEARLVQSRVMAAANSMLGKGCATSRKLPGGNGVRVWRTA